MSKIGKPPKIPSHDFSPGIIGKFDDGVFFSTYKGETNYHLSYQAAREYLLKRKGCDDTSETAS